MVRARPVLLRFVSIENIWWNRPLGSVPPQPALEHEHSLEIFLNNKFCSGNGSSKTGANDDGIVIKTHGALLLRSYYTESLRKCNRIVSSCRLRCRLAWNDLLTDPLKFNFMIRRPLDIAEKGI